MRRRGRKKALGPRAYRVLKRLGLVASPGQGHGR